jgi:hypothetical protein
VVRNTSSVNVLRALSKFFSHSSVAHRWRVTARPMASRERALPHVGSPIDAVTSALSIPQFKVPFFRRHRENIAPIFAKSNVAEAPMHQAPTRQHHSTANQIILNYNMREGIFTRTMVQESAAALRSGWSALTEGTDLQPAFEQRSRPLSRESRAQQSRCTTGGRTASPSDQITIDWPVRTQCKQTTRLLRSTSSPIPVWDRPESRYLSCP